MQEIFDEYLTTFKRVFLDDFNVFGSIVEHLENLKKHLLKCRISLLSLNLTKCAVVVHSGVLLSHVISKEGIEIDENESEVAMDL